MTTFNDLTKGVFMNHPFYNASIEKSIEAIISADSGLSYYIVFSRLGLSTVEVYLNLKSIPNGIAEMGKVYEGKSKRAAIEALRKHLN